MQISDVASWISNADNFGTIVSVASTLIALILGLLIGGIIVSSQAGKQQRTIDEHAKAGVVADVLDCTNDVAVWGQLQPAAQVQSDRAVARADVRLRVLPVQGAGALADWAGHQLNEMKRNSTTGAPLQTTVDQFRDRLVMWIYNPKRAAKQCQRDLERWAFVGGPGAAPAAPTNRRTPAPQTGGLNDTAAFAPELGMPPAMPPAQTAAAQPARGPAPIPASTSSIPAAAAAHAQAAAALPKDPFEDLLGPGSGARR
jgi:hypothetical protein